LKKKVKIRKAKEEEERKIRQAKDAEEAKKKEEEMKILMAKLEVQKLKEEEEQKRIQEEYEKAEASGAPLATLRSILRKKKNVKTMGYIGMGNRYWEKIWCKC